LRFVLGALVLLFNVADNATTFWCLRDRVEGFDIIEANPVARLLFDSVGLAEGLAFEMLVTTLAIIFLVRTPRISSRLRMFLLVVLTLLPAWAALNNLMVMRAVGLSLPL
jgi:uncharacterized protein YacL